MLPPAPQDSPKKDQYKEFRESPQFHKPSVNLHLHHRVSQCKVYFSGIPWKRKIQSKRICVLNSLRRLRHRCINLGSLLWTRRHLCLTVLSLVWAFHIHIFITTTFGAWNNHLWNLLFWGGSWPSSLSWKRNTIVGSPGTQTTSTNFLEIFAFAKIGLSVLGGHQTLWSSIFLKEKHVVHFWFKDILHQTPVSHQSKGCNVFTTATSFRHGILAKFSSSANWRLLKKWAFSFHFPGGSWFWSLA